MHFGSEDPLFPATKLTFGEEGAFEVSGIDRLHWQSTGPIRKIFKAALESVGLTAFHPHSFRRTLVRHGEKFCRSPEEFKAWSQNLGHSDPLTSFTSYGNVPTHRQAEIITQLASRPEDTETGPPSQETINRVLAHLQNQNAVPKKNQHTNRAGWIDLTEEQKKKLEQQLWNIANELRGNMDADEFRGYILGFIFYKYLSEKQYLYANRLLER